ncbi:NADH dehydrogenase-like protein YjlD [Aliarcobacter thereius]|uniref:NADH dehydrogenase FAD-containing subunit n=1 Tax=Aliarcobacter thereius TaxID=544718 RepID=A0A1C0B8S5_9BACT|nr:FAD-dependent oxidoreductase [Aliarcobacter thereius]OCL87482.1 NADH dehydrogenase-like protein YjlD [Aliarcobacter thereius]OCL99973.1 NADH dehydrogenase-like protein YjlD [Aliarcobacter thereius]TLS73365.1 NADH dehydrogenase FAD-containing subunit [Aliarcobacter thereius]TLT08755.1 NADH dehydrogenase FAD-containing subunit [Aliarcobacter thereius]HJE02872.1 FAD-dependent oxidoreductase [Aliarcobacter thereius]
MEKVVIVGGGYAGIFALRELVKNKNIKITLIDKHTYHNLQPEVYELIANNSNFADVTIDLTTLVQGFEHDHLDFKNLKVRKIDQENKKIYTEEQETVEFDYLILAAGTRTFFPPSIPGLNNADDIKKLHRAITFKQSFEKQLFEKIRNEARECDDTHIIVVGAGLSGVEIAAEMAHYSNKFFKRGKFSCDNLKISLISSSSSILPGLKKELINISQKRLKDLGINVITGIKLERVEDGYCYFTNGTKINHSFVVFTGGIEASTISSEIDNIEKNSKGQIIVNEFMQTKNYENIFAIGDIAEIRNKKDEIMPPNVTIAKISGTNAGKNLLRLIDSKPLIKCDPKLDGILIALGGKFAAGDIYGVLTVKGRLAYEIKKYVFSSYRAPLLRILKKGYSKLKKL